MTLEDSYAPAGTQQHNGRRFEIVRIANLIGMLYWRVLGHLRLIAIHDWFTFDYDLFWAHYSVLGGLSIMYLGLAHCWIINIDAFIKWALEGTSNKRRADRSLTKSKRKPWRWGRWMATAMTLLVLLWLFELGELKSTASTEKLNTEVGTVPETGNPVVANSATTQTTDDVVEVTVAKPQLPEQLLAPYVEPELHEIVSREYTLANYTWAAASAAGVRLAHITFPSALATQPHLVAKLSQWAYVRFGVELRITIECSKYHYGSILVSFVPWSDYMNLADDSVDKNRYSIAWQQEFQNGGQILCCNDLTLPNKTLVLKLPWVAPIPWCYNNDWQNEIGTVSIRVFNQLKSIGQSPPTGVLVQVKYKITDVRVMGPDPDVTVSPSPLVSRGGHFKDPRKKFHLNKFPRKKVDSLAVLLKDCSSGPKKERQEKTEKGVVSGVVEAVSDVAPMLTAVPVVGEFAGAAGAIAKTILPFLKSIGLDKPTDQRASDSYKLAMMMDLLGGAGLDSSIRLSLDPGDLIPMEGFSPSGTWNPSVTDFIQKPGYVKTVTWNAAATTSTKLLDLPVDPFLSCETTISFAGSANVLAYVPTPLAWMTQYFENWRGSIKFAFQFVGSSFMRGKVRISYCPTDFVATIEPVGGDYISREVEIEGNQWQTVTIPYMSPFYRQPIQNLPNLAVTTPAGFAGPCGYGAFQRPNITYGRVAISVMTPISVTDGNIAGLYYINVFVGAGEDFSFGRYCGRIAMNMATTETEGFGIAYNTPLYYTPPEATALVDCCSLQEVFKKPFPPLRSDASFSGERGFLGTDRVLSIREIMHRYAKMVPGDHVTMPIWGPLAFRNFVQADPWLNEPDETTQTELSACFRFWRGSYRYRIFILNDESSLDGIRLAQIVPNDSSLYARMTHADELAPGVVIPEVTSAKVEMPWDDIIPYRSVFAESDPLFTSTIEGYGVELGGSTVYRSAGDDFGLSWQVAVPVIWYRAGESDVATGGKQPEKMSHLDKNKQKSSATSSAEAIKKMEEPVQQWVSPYIVIQKEVI